MQAEGDLALWKLEVGRHGRDGPKTYTYWMASWREDGKVHNVYLGSTRRMDAEAALQKARVMKAEVLEYADGMPGGRYAPQSRVMS